MNTDEVVAIYADCDDTELALIISEFAKVVRDRGRNDVGAVLCAAAYALLAHEGLGYELAIMSRPIMDRYRGRLVTDTTQSA